MTRRWSLIAVIAGLAVALTFVIIDIVSSTDSGTKTPAATAATGPATPRLQGVGWWPAHDKSGTVAADATGRHDATLKGGAGWTSGTGGGALLLDGATGYADTGARLLDTTAHDYSVAARVRLDNRRDGRFYTAVSQDGGASSTFYLQYSGADRRFSFSFANARALATKVGDPEEGRWYHLAGTYRQSDHSLKIYVDGVLSGVVQALNPERPAGHLLIGRAKSGGRAADFWSGAIADVHAYRRALTPAEVASLAAHEPGRG